MDSWLKVIKGCDTKTKNTVNAYIHEIQKLFPWKENSYYIIPDIINHICLSFYWIRFAFNEKYVGKNIEIVNETTVKRIEQTDGEHALCAIGESVSRKDCDIFRIEYRLKQNNEKVKRFCPYIGFLKMQYVDSIDAEIGGINKVSWNSHMGLGNSMPDKCVGIAIFNDYKNRLYCTNTMKNFDLGKDVILKSDDRFMLEYDFIGNICYIYYNGEKLANNVDINSEFIIPVVTLYFEGEIMEITKYEFIKK